MVAFLPDALYYEYQYPICVLSVEAMHQKYADKLTHRDYLGALLNLGIERCKIGDLAVQETNCLIFCQETLADYICDNFTKVRHTFVKVTPMELDKFNYKPELTEATGSVASVRLDAILSIAFPLSRSKLVGYIEGGKVFVNGKLIVNNGYRLKEQDIISVRGMGRIIYDGVLSETRKGRYLVRIFKY
jgi:RNA-binding protein YlmH